MTTLRTITITLLASLLCIGSAFGQFISGSDGTDGEFNPVSSIQIDLGLAGDAVWNAPSPVSGRGVYDSDKWAVVFKYTTINIPQGVIVTFKNHRSGAPVIWLASGDVVIDGTVNLNGANGVNSGQLATFAEPGPGGFAGGRRGTNATNNAGSGGFGPGGGGKSCGGCIGGGGYGTPGGVSDNPPSNAGQTYGSASILPLIGGSGGAATDSSQSGGAGAGAILIASSTSISLGLSGSGGINANGGFGFGGGSGGAIRLISNSITGFGQLFATGNGGGGSGGAGRIRLEANNINVNHGGSPEWTSAAIPGPIFPLPNPPRLFVTAIDGIAAPLDPACGILTPDTLINNPGLVTVNIQANNIPLGTTVQVRVVPIRGSVINVTSTPLAGTTALSTATAQVTLPPNQSEIQLRANWTP